jgi:hypothetical protein
MREIHEPGMRTPKLSRMSRWPDSYDKIFAQNAATHVAMDHECQATEHPLFNKTPLSNQCASHTLGELFVKGHGCLRMRSSSRYQQRRAD